MAWYEKSVKVQVFIYEIALEIDQRSGFTLCVPMIQERSDVLNGSLKYADLFRVLSECAIRHSTPVIAQLIVERYMRPKARAFAEALIRTTFIFDREMPKSYDDWTDAEDAPDRIKAVFETFLIMIDQRLHNKPPGKEHQTLTVVQEFLSVAPIIQYQLVNLDYYGMILTNESALMMLAEELKGLTTKQRNALIELLAEKLHRIDHRPDLHEFQTIIRSFKIDNRARCFN